VKRQVFETVGCDSCMNGMEILVLLLFLREMRLARSRISQWLKGGFLRLLDVIDAWMGWIFVCCNNDLEE
jgi:hypothetical protein